MTAKSRLVALMGEGGEGGGGRILSGLVWSGLVGSCLVFYGMVWDIAGSWYVP